MGYYRLYLLDGPKGQFVGFEEIEAADDAAAMRIAGGPRSPGARALVRQAQGQEFRAAEERRLSRPRIRPGRQIRATGRPRAGSPAPGARHGPARPRGRVRGPGRSRRFPGCARSRGARTAPGRCRARRPGSRPPVGDLDRDAGAGIARTATSAEPPYLTALSTRLRTARRSRFGWTAAVRRGPSSKVTSWPKARNSSTTVSARAERSTGRNRFGRAPGPIAPAPACRRASPSSPRWWRSSSARSASGSMLSARMRSEASGVRRSWPIAPSIRSFSSNIAETRALIALKARMARRTSAGPRGSTCGASPRPSKLSAAAVRSRSGRASRIAIETDRGSRISR